MEMAPALPSQKNQSDPETETENPQCLPSQDPYQDLPILSLGMTGLICPLGQDRIVKRPKIYAPKSDPDPRTREYLNEINQQTMENEIKVYKRLGRHAGIIECFKTSRYGIELAFAEGDLEDYINGRREIEEEMKINWMRGLLETFGHMHSCKVFVDDIALRNILIVDGQLKLADFGESVVLPLDTDMATVVENDLNMKIEILHIGWALYSIASWKVCKYYFFDAENGGLEWPAEETFPGVEGVLWGAILKKCWAGAYENVDEILAEARHLPKDTGR